MIALCGRCHPVPLLSAICIAGCKTMTLDDGATHAWSRRSCPVRWVGFDPTTIWSQAIGNPDAIGRDYATYATKGVFRGETLSEFGRGSCDRIRSAPEIDQDAGSGRLVRAVEKTQTAAKPPRLRTAQHNSKQQ